MAINAKLQNTINLAYAPKGFKSVFPRPIKANRDPVNGQDTAEIGQVLVNIVTGTPWMYVQNNVWIQLEGAGGGGVFSTLTVNPGPTNLSTVGNGAVNIGNAANTGAITVTSGTGNVSFIIGGNVLNLGADAAANVVNLGSATAGSLTTIRGGNGTGVGASAIIIQSGNTGDIQVGGVNQTGTVYIGPNTTTGPINIGGIGAGTGTISIGVGTAARSINIGTGAVANLITIGSATAGNITTLASTITALPGPVYIYTGAGAPAGGLALHTGDLYINTTAASATTRMYIATGVGAWTNFTMAA